MKLFSQKPTLLSEARPDHCGRGEDLGDDGAGGDGLELIASPDVEHVHGGRVALLHLDRPHVDLVLVAVGVQEELRGVLDGAQGVGGVVVAVHGEVGDGLQVEEVGAGEHEEVGQHLVGVPVDGQAGEAVEDVEGAVPGLFDHGVDGGDEVLEALLGVELVDLGALSSAETSGSWRAKRK